MQADSSSTNDNASIEPTNKDSTAEKEKLLRDIEDLKCIIEQCERELETVRFENVEEHVSELHQETPSHPREISNVEVDLQNDLYNFAGFHCVKFRKDEVVFNFTSTSERQKKDIYAIQFFIKDGKARLGKWIMPMSIDMDDMLTKIPLDKLENLTPFIKSCKHDIDCYVVRQEQFLSLKKQISNMKHCTLQSDMGYTNIVLELYGVHDRESDGYMNLIIYLFYHSNKARPHKINIDTMEKNKLNNDLKQRLKVCLNEFKISDLSTAFDKILTEDSAFTWMRASDSDSPLELNDTSSCESLLVELQLVRKKSLRKLQKKWNKRRKQRIISTNIESSDNEDDNQTKEARTESSLQILRREKEVEPVPSTSKQQTKIYKNLTEETPLHKPKVRFKQTKLNFQTNQTANSASSINEGLSFASKPHDKLENPKKKLKIIPLGTSTPLHRSRRRISSSSSLEIDNITDIKATTRPADKFNDIENSRLTNKKIKRRKTPKLVSTTKAVKTNQRYTRSMKSNSRLTNKKIKRRKTPKLVSTTPALHLIGIAASPGGGGEVFGSRAEEELRQWLEARLDALGIDPVAYSRFVLSLLRRPDSALSPPEEAIELGRGTGRRIRARSKAKLPTHGDREQRRAVVQCLTSAADDKYGVETLVDELCIKLKELEGGSSHDEKEESKKSSAEPKTNLEALTPRDRALRYYAAFPSLESVSIKKFSLKNSVNSNNNKDNGINLHNNKNNSAHNKKTKMSISIESQRSEDKESFGFVKSMEREREKERELELDQLRLAQLKAKFNENLEALWNSVPGNAQDTASIWAAPTLSIPSGPLWPTDTTKTIFTLPISNNDYATDTPNQDSIVDESPLIPWDIDLISIEDNADEYSNKNTAEYNINWSDSVTDGPWCWRGIDSNLATGLYCHNPQTGSCFFPVASCKTPIGTCKQSRSSLKVNSLPEPDEDLLTSMRTHFRPIKDDGHWADGTTFPVNNTVERVAYRRSESGNLLYLPGGESPYMEYRESDAVMPPVSTNLTLKFRVRQCDKGVQTEPIRSPVKRRILSEQDHFRYSPIGAEDATILEQENIEKDSFDSEWPQLNWVQSSVPLHNDRKRRHSSSFGCQPLTTLRPLTL